LAEDWGGKQATAVLYYHGALSHGGFRPGATFSFLPRVTESTTAAVAAGCICVYTQGENASSKSAEEDEKTSEMMAQIFGSNLQVTVWVCTLSYAGYTGYQQMQVDPSSVGMLLAPPLGALALMTSFGLFYSAKIASQKDAAAALAAKRAAEEAE
jgi:hypothetical protein